jgi:hypothetical protein
MKLIIEKKDFKNEFTYYDDQLGTKYDKIVEVKFWYQGEEVDIEEIELVFNKPKKEEPKETVSIEDYEMLAGENKCFAEWLEARGYNSEEISKIACGSFR